MWRVEPVSWEEIETHRASIRDALHEIGQHDPASRESRPTDEDYARFRLWAIDAYGLTIWQLYNTAQF